MAPAPYYEQDGIVIYHGEALAVLPFLDACSMDCMLTDPPYCSGGYLEAQKNTRAQGLRGSTLNTPNFEWFAADNMSTIGLTWLLRAVMLEARRILRTNRAAFVFTDWRMVPHLVPVIESSGLRYRDMLVWDKGSAGLGVGFKPSHEILLEFAAGTVEYQTMTGQNVLRYRRVTSQSKEHNAQKPVELLRGVLDVAVPHGGIVCDPFMGSGSTLLAAAKSGRLAVGIEIEERYCEIAATRLKQGVLNLFGEATA